jgi:hypothetical protein
MRILAFLALFFFTCAGYSQEITKIKISQNIYDATVKYLLEDVRLILDTDLPSEQPEIYIAPITAIQDAYCEEKRHCNVAAVTDRKTGEIVMSTGFIPNNLISVSILFHELVHWVQVKKGMFKNESECMLWAKSEMHAYQAQSKFVAKYDGKGFEVPDLTEQCK